MRDVNVLFDVGSGKNTRTKNIILLNKECGKTKNNLSRK